MSETGHETGCETLRDPVVWAGALAAVLAHAWLFFAGEYLPYVDWSNHIGLISLFARGSPYVERSLAPTPYLLFYACSALLGQLLPIVVAAKIGLLIATFLFTFGAAFLAEQTGRDPRLGLVAPLAMFGVSLGYGFASFIFAAPLILFAFAATERALFSPSRKNTAVLGGTILLVYLGHAMVFAVAAVAIFVRTVVRTAASRSVRPFARVALASLPTVLLGVPLLVRTINHPFREAGAQPADGSIFTFAWDRQLNNIGGHLLERGSSAHWTTMNLALGLLLFWLILSLFRGKRTTRTWGLEIYAACLAAVYLFGPISIDWPFSVWMVHARFATLAALLLFLLPKVDLSGKLGGALACASLALVLHNAAINRGHIEHFNERATRYDPVRALIPKGARVLALTVVPRGDLARSHRALGSLYFYHLADGACYTAFLFDAPLLPVRLKEDRPRAPFWRTPHRFDPTTHGKDYDYLVLRGAGLIARAKRSKNHRLVKNVDGWAVFETLDPTPIP